jgi:glycosyltransferase involved in cell wall biosynthesis
MRVLIISSPNPYGRGGEIRSYKILKNMKRFRVNIDLITDLDNNLVVNELANYVNEIYRVKCSSIHEVCIASIFRLASSLRSEDYDLVISQSEHPRYSLSAFSASRILRRPWSAIVNSFIYICPSSNKISLSRFTRNSIALHALNKTIVHLVSYAIQNELLRRGFGFNNYDVLEIPVGVDWEVIEKVTKHKPEKEYHIAFMGVLSAEKGIYDIAYVIYKLKKELNKSIKALFVGEFSSSIERSRYLSVLNKLDIRDNIVFKGYLTGEDKYRELSKAKLFIFPSRVDALPISILEALALGLPVITWDLPYSREFTTNGVIKTRSIDEIIKVTKTLLIDDEKWEKLGKIGSEYARRYTWENATLSEYRAYLKTIEWWVNEVK